MIARHNVEIIKKQKLAIALAASAVITYVSKTLKEKRHYKKKRIWISELFQQRLYGFYHAILLTLKSEDLRFQNYFRMSTSQFEELSQLVAPKITRLYVIRELIEAEQRLTICLKFEIL